MRASVIRETQVLALSGLLLSVNILTNKWWVRLVLAVVVTPAPQVVIAFIGFKASVADLVSPL